MMKKDTDNVEHADAYLQSQTTTNAVTDAVRKRLEKFNRAHSSPGFEPLKPHSTFPAALTCTEEDLAIARTIETSLGIFVNQSKDVFLVANEDSTMTYVSHACVSLLGYQEEDLIGTRFLDLVYPGDYQATVALMQKHMPRRHVYSFVNRLRTRQDGIVTVDWAATSWSVDHKTYARIRAAAPSQLPPRL